MANGKAVMISSRVENGPPYTTIRTAAAAGGCTPTKLHSALFFLLVVFYWMEKVCFDESEWREGGREEGRDGWICWIRRSRAVRWSSMQCVDGAVPYRIVSYRTAPQNPFFDKLFAFDRFDLARTNRFDHTGTIGPDHDVPPMGDERIYIIYCVMCNDDTLLEIVSSDWSCSLASIVIDRDHLSPNDSCDPRVYPYKLQRCQSINQSIKIVKFVGSILEDLVLDVHKHHQVTVVDVVTRWFRLDGLREFLKLYPFVVLHCAGVVVNGSHPNLVDENPQLLVVIVEKLHILVPIRG
mmetsp:Transcript_3337/g.8031  ORF Transcript_3337/g.8031 Transcript_3337/m.8031 type:complete len:295 (+) Transcript_3337:376-1260(+)